MPKLENRKVLMDRMPTFVGEATEYLHEGQWVSVRPLITQRMMIVALELMASDYGKRAMTTDGMEPEEAAAEFQRIADERRRLNDLVAELVVEQELSAYDGTKLPSPVEAGGKAYDLLTAEEMAYLSYGVVLAVTRPGMAELDPAAGFTPPPEAEVEREDRD